jgi:hypothetical protein
MASLVSSPRSGCSRRIAYPRRSRSLATLVDTENLAHPAGAKRHRRTLSPDDRPLRETCRLLLSSPAQLQSSPASRVPMPSRSGRYRLGSPRRSGSSLSLRYARSAQGSPLQPSKMLREPGGAVGSPPRSATPVTVPDRWHHLPARSPGPSSGGPPSEGRAARRVRVPPANFRGKLRSSGTAEAGTNVSATRRKPTREKNNRGSRLYFFAASAASFSRYFLVISSCSCFGTMEYLANSIVNVPLPCVAERRSVE